MRNVGASSASLAGLRRRPCVFLWGDFALTPYLNRLTTGEVWLKPPSQHYKDMRIVTIFNGFCKQIAIWLSLFQFYTYTLGEQGPMLVGSFFINQIFIKIDFRMYATLQLNGERRRKGSSTNLNDFQVGDSSSVIFFSSEKSSWLWIDRQTKLIFINFLGARNFIGLVGFGALVVDCWWRLPLSEWIFVLNTT